MKLTTGNPKVKLHIKKLVNSRSFEGVIVSGQIPSFYYGNQHDYCISGNCLYRMEAYFADELSPLMSLHSDHDGNIQFQIGRKNLSEFYYTVLPELRRIAARKLKPTCRRRSHSSFIWM